VTRVDVPIVGTGARAYFKVEQAYTNSPGGLPANLRVTVEKLINGTVQLRWDASIGHGYLVEGSTNGKTWTPISDWIVANAITTTFTLPPATPNGPYLYRVQVSQ
jgi:hypothetical protein